MGSGKDILITLFHHFLVCGATGWGTQHLQGKWLGPACGLSGNVQCNHKVWHPERLYVADSFIHLPIRCSPIHLPINNVLTSHTQNFLESWRESCFHVSGISESGSLLIIQWVGNNKHRENVTAVLPQLAGGILTGRYSFSDTEKKPEGRFFSSGGEKWAKA